MTYNKLRDPEIQQKYSENQIDKLYRVLSNEEAKNLLEVLEAEENLSIQEVTETLEGYDGSTSDTEITLRHRDIPKLVETSVIDLDSSEVISPGECYEDAKKILSTHDDIDLRVLADGFRRDLLSVLEEQGRTRYEDENDLLDSYIESRLSEQENPSFGEIDYDSLETQLYHVHVPFMEDVGLLERHEGQIVYSEI